MCREAGSIQTEHTADLALRVWAPEIGAFFREAARGLGRLLFDPGDVKPKQEFELEVEGIDLEELLVGWLNEILYRIEEETLAFDDVGRLEVRGNSRDGYRLRATLIGEPRDPERLGLRAAIKSATYHGLVIDPESETGYDLTIVFDT